MIRQAAKTLVLPFERQNLDQPTAQNRWLFLNAHPLENVPQWIDGLVCEQSFRPLFNDLLKSGYDVHPSVEAGTTYAGALVLTNRFAELNRQMVARAICSVEPGKPVLVAGEKTSGIVSLRKWAAKHAAVLDEMSKFHARVLRINTEIPAPFTQILQDFDDNSGVFGAKKVDVGSALLASTFDESIQGEVADFCAGTGYLSQQLLQKSGPLKIDLYEAEHRALEMAKAGLADSATPLNFHWLDLAQEPVADRYDWIVMNPPFHAGRAAEPRIGQNMIKAARKALRPRGKLRLVANRQLPYENTLKEVFGGFRELVARDGFKVLEA